MSPEFHPKPHTDQEPGSVEMCAAALGSVADRRFGGFWRVMVKGDDYVEKGIAHYEEQVRKNKERALRRLAKELGQQLVPVEQSA
jgi:hypothetical protein